MEKLIDMVEEFLKLTKNIEYKNHGIMPMEAFSLYKYCRDNKIDVLLESGTANGYSTELLGNLLPDVTIYTIDMTNLYGPDTQKNTQERLSYLSNVNFVIGDSVSILPKLIEQCKNNRIGVFIDGPKGNTALLLANEVIKYSNVLFVGCHDLHISDNNTYCPNLDEDFTKKYKFLDDEVVKLPTPKDNNITIGQKWPKGMGIIFKTS